MTPTTHHKEDGGVTLDTIFRALSRSPRRQILTVVGKQNPRNSAELEAETLLETTDGLETKYAELYHNHLPALDAAEFINWDPETDSITRGSQYEQIRPVLELMYNHRDELPDGWP